MSLCYCVSVCVAVCEGVCVPLGYTLFYISNIFFGVASDVAKRNSNPPKISLTVLDKKVFKMLVRKGAIIWKRSWSLVLNIFQDLCLRIGRFQASVAYKRKSV